jgi:ABC-2 type transport system permease protein
MKRLLALTWKEFLQLKRDPLTVRMIAVVPIMQLLIFGYAINYDVKRLTTVVLDESRSFDSRELVAKMEASEYFTVVGRVDSLDEMRRAIDSASASVGLVIDRNYGKDLHRGRPGTSAKALLIVNASDSTTANQAMSVASGISSGISFQMLGGHDGRPTAKPIDLRVRPWYNPEMKTANFIIPGLIAIVLTFTLMQYTATSIVREREFGTLEQLQVAPLRRSELIIGKILPFLVIGYVQLTILVVMMRWLFDVETQGSMVALYILTGLYIAAVLGLGILISAISDTQMQASQLAMFFALPFVFLSGYVFPIDGMPAFFQFLATLIPANYIIQIMRGIILRGASVVDLWEPIMWLTLYTAAIVTIAVMRFKKIAD